MVHIISLHMNFSQNVQHAVKYHKVIVQVQIQSMIPVFSLLHSPRRKQADTGVLSADVANFRGSELPSTGGTGTTLFYIAGNTAVVVACFVLVMKKKENVA